LGGGLTEMPLSWAELVYDSYRHLAPFVLEELCRRFGNGSNRFERRLRDNAEPRAFKFYPSGVALRVLGNVIATQIGEWLSWRVT